MFPFISYKLNQNKTIFCFECFFGFAPLVHFTPIRASFALVIQLTNNNILKVGFKRLLQSSLFLFSTFSRTLTSIKYLCKVNAADLMITLAVHCSIYLFLSFEVLYSVCLAFHFPIFNIYAQIPGKILGSKQ